MTSWPLACPHCGDALTPVDGGIRCPASHHFDRASEGYFNLLPAGKRVAAAAPGDTLDALRARRAFLDAGHYQPIADAVAAAIGTTAGVVLDAGCGEGYYLSQIRAERRMGCDVAKAGVRMAAKRDTGALFFVGSSFRLPLLAGSLAAVLTVFAPRPAAEFARVLAPGGCVVAVTPALRHLEELRVAAGQGEAPPRRDAPPPGASSAERVSFSLDLPADQAALLLAMTPIAGFASATTALPRRVTGDVWVVTYQH